VPDIETGPYKRRTKTAVLSISALEQMESFIDKKRISRRLTS